MRYAITRLLLFIYSIPNEHVYNDGDTSDSDTSKTEYWNNGFGEILVEYW